MKLLQSAVVLSLAVTVHTTGLCHQSLVGRTIAPVDQAHTDPSFLSFRDALLEAARSGDVGHTLALTSPTVKSNEFGASGLAEFKRGWEIDRDPSAFLKALIGALTLGGRFDAKGRFVAPWPYTEFPGSTWETKTHIVVVRPASPVFPVADDRSKAIAEVSHVILGLAAGPPWYEVTLPDGRKGYMRSQDVRQPSDPSAVFERIDGVWKLTLLTKGMD